MPEHPTRDDNETTTTRCPICRTPFIAVRRQRYCTNACRQIGYRRRHHTADPVVVLHPPGEPPTFRTPDPIGSGPEWRTISARASPQV
jgi:hypothetical protein